MFARWPRYSCGSGKAEKMTQMVKQFLTKGKDRCLPLKAYLGIRANDISPDEILMGHKKNRQRPVLPSLNCLKRWTGQFGHFIARFTKSSLKALANDNQQSGFVLFPAHNICVADISSYSNVTSSSSTSGVLLDEYWKGNGTPQPQVLGQQPKKMWRSADCLFNLSSWGTTWGRSRSSQPQPTAHRAT